MNTNSGFDWHNYLKKGYFDENGKPRREIYIDWAKAIAEELSKKRMTRTSIRRFYTLVKGLEPLLKEPDTFEEEKYRLYPVIPLAHQAVTKEEGRLPYEFKKFMEKNINEAVKSSKHFLAFIGHFQSVIAYLKSK